MHKSISKRLLAGLLSVVMVLSLFAAVPANNAQAAATVKINSYKTVKAGNTVNYTIKNLTKNQYAKVSVTGTAKAGITVKKGTTTVKSTTKINGTGKNIVLKVKNYGVPGKKYALTVKVYNKKTNKLVKTVNTKTAFVYKLTTTVAITPNTVDEMEVGGTVVLTAAKAPANSTQAITWSTSDKAVATVDGGIVTAVAAGTATITATSGKKSASVVINVKAEEKPDEPIEENKGELPEITSVKAAKVDTIEVTFASAVTAEDVAFTVTKGNNAVTTGAAKWNDEKTVATLTTDSKMTEGTYVVKAASAKLDKTVEGTFAVEAQRVAEIVIEENVALTLPGTLTGIAGQVDAVKARIYYDVKDQYGQSVRSTTSLSWSTSCGTPFVSAAKGYIEVKRSDNKAFTYGEQVFVTAVHEKTGLSYNKTLTIGMAQQLDKVELVGFVKTNTSTLVESLPANFKSNEYSLVYSTVDQNGNELDAATDNIATSKVTFLSNNAMLVGAKFVDGDIVIIDGVEYCSAKIESGIRVSDGGEVTITAISNKTGTKNEKVFTVGEDVKLTTFTLGQPKKMVADEEKVELEFAAYDQNGKEITSFVNIAKNNQFNALSFTVNVGTVTLKEENDGTASLWYEALPAVAGKEMDGVDVPVVITAIVINGDGSNTQFNVLDQARPEGITGVNAKALAEVNLEGTQLTFAPASFTYVDQYGRAMTTAKAKEFLDAQHVDGGKTYKYSIKLDYVGDGFTTTTGVAIAKDTYYATTATPKVVLTSKKVYGTAKTNDLVKFSIVRNVTGETDKIEGVSPEKSISFTTVDVDMLKNIQVAAQHTVQLQTANTNNDFIADPNNQTPGALAGATVVNTCTAEKYAKVYGYYNDVKVLIGNEYVDIKGSQFFNKNNAAAPDDVPSIDVALTWSDLYDFTTAKNTRKAVQYDKLIYTINKIYKNYEDTVGGVDLGGTFTPAAIATANSKLGYSDGYRAAAGIYASADTFVINPTNTKTDAAWAMNANGVVVSPTELAVAYDQYGDDYLGGLSYEIKNYVESKDGQVENNHRVSGQGTATVNVVGAENGDTFDLVITLTNAKGQEVTIKTIKVVVGADTQAYVDNNGNAYSNTTVGGGLYQKLNAQREGKY